jgi:hypothetical protein
LRVIQVQVAAGDSMAGRSGPRPPVSWEYNIEGDELGRAWERHLWGEWAREGATGTEGVHCLS